MISPSTIEAPDCGNVGRGFNRMRSTPIQPSDSTSNPQSASAEVLAPPNDHRWSSIDR